MSTERATPESLHLALWHDRLQDAIDQLLSASESAAVQTHLASCVVCSKEQRRLLAIDAHLRGEFSVAPTPAALFDKRLFERIAALEQDERAQARRREQQEYAARLAQLRNSWRGLLRFHLGNLIGVVATVAAVVAAIASARPTTTPIRAMDWIVTQEVAWLPQGWNSAMPVTVLASLGIAAAAIWITRRIDRHPG